MAKALPPQGGEIGRVQFGSLVGAEMRKIRPAVVISLDTVGRLPLRIVVPLTDWHLERPEVRCLLLAKRPWPRQPPQLPFRMDEQDKGAYPSTQKRRAEGARALVRRPADARGVPMRDVVWVTLGAVVGANLRFAVSRWALKHLSASLP